MGAPAVPEDLVKLLGLRDFHKEAFCVQQFVISTITDDPPREGYRGIGAFGFGRGPDEEEMRRIRALFEEAGIPAQKYRALQ